MTDKWRIRIGYFSLFCSSSDKIVPICKANCFTFSSYRSTDQEGIYFFMRFEKSSANISEHEFGDTVHNIIYSLFESIWGSTVLYCYTEKFFKIFKWELIHRIDKCKICDDKIQHCTSDGDWNVRASWNVDLLLNCSCLLKFFLYNGRILFTFFKSFNQFHIIQNISFTFWQKCQNIILCLFQQFLSFWNRNNNLILLLFYFRSFVLYYISK